MDTVPNTYIAENIATFNYIRHQGRPDCGNTS